MLEVGAGVVAWLGTSVVVLADGRRGLALGLLMSALGLAGLVWLDAGWMEAAAIAAGGVAAAVGRLRSGSPGWQVMPPGSTPRLVMCVAAAIVALWVAFAITTGPDAGLRFAALACLALAPARVLWSAEVAVGLTCVGVLSLAMGAATAAGGTAPGMWPYAAGALLAAGVAWLPARPARAA